MLRALMAKELRALLRDIHGLGALFVMPLVFIVIMSLALKDVLQPAHPAVRLRRRHERRRPRCTRIG
ncbi:MAG: hypothetical protein QM803_00805 [Rhodocyclaceae bacterium]